MSGDLNTKAHILWGVCGIGQGHIFRQLPLIEHFAPRSTIVIFGYGESYDFYSKRFADHANVTVVRVAVPFYVGGKDGLDFAATSQKLENHEDYVGINSAAMAIAEDRLRRPDLVISDYEPVSAQYAYAHNTPLVTIDQQSKYLIGDFAAPLNEQTFADEIMRLRMFFPKAEWRLACSFFNVRQKQNATENVEIHAPVLNDVVRNLGRSPSDNTASILIYVSSQKPFGQNFQEINTICETLPGVQFHCFGKNIPPSMATNLTCYEHGHYDFHKILASCNGIVTTAGHNLLSEAMYLGIPVYAIPLPLYEQHMNAHVIHENGFGISYPKLDAEILAGFIQNLGRYEEAIKRDDTVLLRGDGQTLIIDRLQKYLGEAAPC